uniref:Zinc finger protein n=1 Tax=Pristionchus pacificus TaxID=54126 RepID=A0A2A6C7R6_PRIPA|eukprot:PDM74093.1 zinc finger protein [Pristionchus pacificus]
MPAVEEAASDGASDATPAAAAASAAAAAEPIGTGRVKRRSALKRAKDKVASHVSAVSALLAQHQDEVHVEFADASLRALQALLHGQCVPSVEIARLQHDFSRDGQPGERALMHLGAAIRSMCIARNEQVTRSEGFEPDEYGLPRIRVKPPVYGQEEEPLWDGQQPPVDEEQRQIWYTRGHLSGVTGHVDISRLPPLSRDLEQSEGEEDTIRRKRHFAVDGPAPPFEYREDSSGNVLVKSEMMGDEEFFDYQLQQRDLATRYEELARTGQYQERFIMHKLTGRGAKTGKIYECHECGAIFPTQHKFAAHKRYAHPKSSEMPAAIGRGKRERRAPPARDEMISHSGTSPPAPAPTKMYTCPICEEVCNSQHKFASHMRYKHPKGSAEDSMAASPSLSSPSPLVASACKMTSSAAASATMKMMGSSAVAATATPSGGGERGEQEQFVCKLCGRAFSSSLKLGGHTGRCRAAQAAAAAGATTSSATPSSSKVASSGQKRKDETMEEGETTSKNYPCSICARVFDNNYSLASHIRHCRNAAAAAAAAAASPAAAGATPTPAAAAAAAASSMTSSAVLQTPPARKPSATRKEKAVDLQREKSAGSVAVQAEDTEEVKKAEGETPKKSYACHVCARPFDNYNGLAGHTRHCLARNKDPLPMSPLALPVKAATIGPATATPRLQAGGEKTEKREKEAGVKKEPQPVSPLTGDNAGGGKTVEKEGEGVERKEAEKETPKPAQQGRKRTASVIVKDEERKGEKDEEKETEEEIDAASTVAVAAAAAAVTPVMARGKVVRPFTMSTRSSRARASTTGTPQPVDTPSPGGDLLDAATTLAPFAVPTPPVKRARTEAPPTPIADGSSIKIEMKEEKMEQEQAVESARQSVKKAKRSSK